jgi:hypothetical protein
LSCEHENLEVKSYDNGKLGDELKHSTLNSKFAEKVGAELDAANVKWSGKLVEGGKTVIAVAKSDETKLSDCFCNTR